jgi:hypothetical protein
LPGLHFGETPCVVCCSLSYAFAVLMVLRLVHEKKPFHVMIGGGDQVYSDDVRLEGGPLEEWGNELKPKKRAAMPCSPELEHKIDEWLVRTTCL